MAGQTGFRGQENKSLFCLQFKLAEVLIWAGKGSRYLVRGLPVGQRGQELCLPQC